MGYQPTPFNPSPASPSLLQRQNVAIWGKDGYEYHVVEFIEGMPRDSRLLQDLGALAANGQSQRTQITVTNMAEGQIGEFRFCPLDDVALEAYQPAGTAHWQGDTAIARVCLDTGEFDPFWVASTVWVLGNQRSLQLMAYNLCPFAIPHSRAQFWGWRYILGEKITKAEEIEAMKAKGMTYFNAEAVSSAAAQRGK